MNAASAQTGETGSDNPGFSAIPNRESPIRALRIAVLASGRGSNLQALLDAQRRSELAIELVLVASDKAHARVLRRAEEAGIATLALDPKGYPDRASFDADLFARVASYAPDLIVLAGFMRVLDASVLAAWSGRIINIHPSLLPKYRGLHTHQRALDAGDTLHGASVHFVTAELDGGPVLCQVAIPLRPDDTARTLAERLLQHEHRLLVASIKLLASARIRLVGGRIVHDDVVLDKPLMLDSAGGLSARA